MKQLELETELSELGAKLDELMEENDGLRKGMREILDSVRNQDASSDVRIEAPEIERLLGILDARHLWGSYHPAMGLKNRIEQLEGINSGKILRSRKLLFLFVYALLLRMSYETSLRLAKLWSLGCVTSPFGSLSQ